METKTTTRNFLTSIPVAERRSGTSSHPHVEVTAPSGQRIEVDIEMEYILRDVWDLGFDTQFSCQDLNGRGRAQIVFFDIDECMDFVKLVSKQDPYLVFNSFSINPMIPWDDSCLRASLYIKREYLATFELVLQNLVIQKSFINGEREIK